MGTVQYKKVVVRVSGERRWAFAEGDTGFVRVFDPVAGYYTLCHSLTPGQVQYVRNHTMGKSA